jgi:hypothetical protein
MINFDISGMENLDLFEEFCEYLLLGCVSFSGQWKNINVEIFCAFEDKEGERFVKKFSYDKAKSMPEIMKSLRIYIANIEKEFKSNYVKLHKFELAVA